MTFADQLALGFGLSLGQLATIVVALFGLGFALFRRRQLGRVSTWATWGFGLFLTYSVVRIAARVGLEAYRSAASFDPLDDRYIFWLGTSNAATALLYFIAFAILVKCIFMDRGITSGSTDPNTQN